jgi:hypothetical protein
MSGTIKSVDAKNHELTLDDGKTYQVATNVTLTGLKAGDKVKIDEEMKNGKNVVSKIEQTGSQSTGSAASSLSGGGSSPSSSSSTTTPSPAPK